MRALHNWAVNTKAKEHWINNNTVYQGPSPLGAYKTKGTTRSGVVSDQETNGKITHGHAALWEQHIITFGLGRAEETGLTGADMLKEWLGTFPVNIITTPGSNKYLAALYDNSTTVLGWNTQAEITAAISDPVYSAHCAALVPISIDPVQIWQELELSG